MQGPKGTSLIASGANLQLGRTQVTNVFVHQNRAIPDANDLAGGLWQQEPYHIPLKKRCRIARENKLSEMAANESQEVEVPEEIMVDADGDTSSDSNAICILDSENYIIKELLMLMVSKRKYSNPIRKTNRAHRKYFFSTFQLDQILSPSGLFFV